MDYLIGIVVGENSRDIFVLFYVRFYTLTTTGIHEDVIFDSEFDSSAKFKKI